MAMAPRYPEVRIRLHSRNPFAWVSAIRQALRHSQVDDREILQFTEEALGQHDPHRIREVCSTWAEIEVR